MASLPDEISALAERIVAKWRLVRQGDKTWVFKGKWLRAGTVHYTAPDGRKRAWETTERTTRTGPVDGVDIVAFVKGAETTICLVAIYRPPVHSISIEFPAGLLGEGEIVQDAAMRELKEETGLCGRIDSCSDKIYTDPWKSNENSVVCQMTADKPHNATRTLNLDDDEFLEPIELPLKNLLEHLNRLRDLYGFVIEAKLHMFALGFHIGKSDQ